MSSSKTSTRRSGTEMLLSKITGTKVEPKPAEEPPKEVTTKVEAPAPATIVEKNVKKPIKESRVRKNYTLARSSVLLLRSIQNKEIEVDGKSTPEGRLIDEAIVLLAKSKKVPVK
jgi:hypothetical protein